MAAYEIEVLEKADEDMRLIGKYIFGELKSPMAAERITDKIWDEIEKLSKIRMSIRFIFPYPL